MYHTDCNKQARIRECLISRRLVVVVVVVALLVGAAVAVGAVAVAVATEGEEAQQPELGHKGSALQVLHQAAGSRHQNVHG